VGVVFVDVGGQGKGVAHSATSRSKGQTSPAPPGTFPSVVSPSNVVVLNPATGDVIAASPSERAAAALHAAAEAAAALQAAQNAGQEASQAANAEAQAAAERAAATQSTHR
jgi:acyl-CoA reductase-like NAD-dependent aldehyde dehydrogenase